MKTLHRLARALHARETAPLNYCARCAWWHEGDPCQPAR